jgi:colanic acid/amylovoran biosynthesis protein
MYNTYGELYIEQLIHSVKLCEIHNITPVFLVHNFTSNDSSSDKLVTNKLYELCKKSGVEGFLIEDEYSPAELKQVLKNALFSITSRYHVVVGSFSCNTPSIAIGWSHKYEEFMRLYDLEHLNLYFNDKLANEIFKHVSSLIDSDFHTLLLKSKNSHLKSKVSNSFCELSKCLEQIITAK